MSGKKFFLNVSKGLFFEKDLPGQTAKQFNIITGHLVNINFKTIAEGEVMRLHLVDDMNFYVLSFFVRSRPAHAFFQMAKNLDLTQDMNLQIYSIEGKDYFKIFQSGSAVQWFFVDDNKELLPLMPEERQRFFVQYLKEELIPILEKKINPYPNHLLYKPAAKKALQGGYFDAYESNAGFPKPVGSYERQDQSFWGKGRAYK